MKIIIFGATGTIGSAIARELSDRHEVLLVAKNNGDLKCDITDKESVSDLFKKVGEFDAIVSATGSVHFAAFENMTDDLYQIGLQNKLMGQVNLAYRS